MSFPDEWEIVTDSLNASVKGSLDTRKVNVLELMKLASITDLSEISFKVCDEEYIKLLPPLREQVLSTNDADWLLTIYKQLYPSKNISFSLPFAAGVIKYFMEMITLDEVMSVLL